eukprot:6480484-Amphidinium_carterae.1
MDDFRGVSGNKETIKIFCEEASRLIMLKTSGPFRTGDSFDHLKRSRRITEYGVHIKPCRLHASRVVELLGLDGARVAPTPRAELGKRDGDKLDEPLEDEFIPVFRTCVGKLLYLSQNRQDVAYATKELARQLQQPTKGAMAHLKRLARYLKGTMDLEVVAPKAYSDNAMTIDIDSDHAGCKDSRKSTTGILIQWSGCRTRETS